MRVVVWVCIPGFDQLLRGFDEALHLIAILQEIHDAEAEEGVKRTAITKDKKDP